MRIPFSRDVRRTRRNKKKLAEGGEREGGLLLGREGEAASVRAGLLILGGSYEMSNAGRSEVLRQRELDDEEG